MQSVEELKAKVLSAVESGDIASLFVMEERAHELFDEDMLGAFYANILDLALEKLTDALEAHRVMDMNEVQDFATIKALYEYGMEHYSAGKISDAAALFEVLGGLTNDKDFSSALKLHTIGAQKNITLDDFIDTIADIQETQNRGTFYISSFSKEAQKLLESSQSMGSGE